MSNQYSCNHRWKTRGTKLCPNCSAKISVCARACHRCLSFVQYLAVPAYEEPDCAYIEMKNTDQKLPTWWPKNLTCTPELIPQVLLLTTNKPGRPLPELKAARDKLITEAEVLVLKKRKTKTDNMPNIIKKRTKETEEDQQSP